MNFFSYCCCSIFAKSTLYQFRERKCADTIGIVLVPWAGPFQCYNINRYTAAISSNSTRKLLWFEINKMLIAVLKNKYIVLFIIIFGTFAPCSESDVVTSPHCTQS